MLGVFGIINKLNETNFLSLARLLLLNKKKKKKKEARLLLLKIYFKKLKEITKSCFLILCLKGSPKKGYKI